MEASGALFGRSDVARLLNIPEWTLANFADRRYPYGLAPSVPGGRGRGKKGLYTLADVYKIATAHRMLIADQDSRVIADSLRELFPENKDPMAIAVKERAKDWADARCVLIDFGMGLWFVPASGNEFVVPPEWHSKKAPAKPSWVVLLSRRNIAQEIGHGTRKLCFLMPFDELLNWVDSQILGREVTFTRSVPTAQKTKKR